MSGKYFSLLCPLGLSLRNTPLACLWGEDSADPLENLKQHHPRESSAMMEMFSTCSAHKDACGYLKCDWCNWVMGFFYLINLNLNSHIWLVAICLDSAFLEHTQNNVTRPFTMAYTVIIVQTFPGGRGTELPPQAIWGLAQLKTGNQNTDYQ